MSDNNAKPKIWALSAPTTWAVALFFVILTLAMTWPWPMYMTQSLTAPVGDVALQMTVLQWNAHALVTNPLGLFEAPFFYPYAHSIAFSENLIGETLIALPLLWFTGNPALAFNFNIMLSFVLTGLFTYLLARDLTGSRAAALFAGVAFAFCPFRFMHIGHQHMLATQWFPFTLWALGRWLGTGKERPIASSTRWLAWAAFGFIAMGLSSVYYTFYLFIALLLYALWWLLLGPGLSRRKEIEWVPLSLRLGAAALAVAIVLLPVFLPYAQTNSELGLSRSIYEVDNWSAEWSFFGSVPKGNWLYAQVLAPGMGAVSGERQLFPGILPAVLAVVGLVWGRSRQRFYYLLLGLFSLAMTFGLSRTLPGTNIDVPLPYALFYYWMPGFQALRVPVRFSVLVDFSIYILAAYGLARLLDVGAEGMAGRVGRWRRRLGKRTRTAVAVISIALLLLEFANPLDASGRQDLMAQLTTIEPYGWLAKAENAGPVLELPMSADQPDVSYMLFSTRNWQPLVNGWSGFVPPGTVALKQALDSFPDPLTISLLQGLEVRHVVVHLWEFPGDRQAALKARLDKTAQLKLVDQAGENYVYELASDPWLRAIARQVGDATLWVGEARQGTMPTLEVLAYALQRWGVAANRMGGNINIGYRPIGPLPFGVASDYVLVPNPPGAQAVPLGFEGAQVVASNPAIRLLKRDPGLLRSYDLTQAGAPTGNLLRMRVGTSAIAFDESAMESGRSSRYLEVMFNAFASSEVVVDTGGRQETLRLPPGVSSYMTGPLDTPQEVTVTGGDNAKAIRVTLRSAPGASAQPGLAARPSLMPLQLDSASLRNGGAFVTHLRVVAPRTNEDHYTLTLDVYVQPWGTHPQGHFGSWSVVLPADGMAHDLDLELDPVAKTVTTLRDGVPVQTFTGFIGEPTQGGFKASLTVLNSQGIIASLPIYTFTRKDSRIADWQLEPGTFTVAQP